MTTITPLHRTNGTVEPLMIDLADDITSGRDVHIVDLTIAYEQSGRTSVPVKNFDLYAPAGRVTALVGRSGSGKTSILSSVAGMLRPHSGAVWLGGIEVSALQGKSLDNYRRHHVGVVHQAYNLIASLSVLENVTVPLGLIGVNRDVANERAKRLLAELGISELARKHPHELSGGQQQRVAVARALATEPSVVLADEPTAHLDGSSVHDVSSLLSSMAKAGRTVIVSTHDDRLLPAADQIVYLNAA